MATRLFVVLRKQCKTNVTRTGIKSWFSGTHVKYALNLFNVYIAELHVFCDVHAH